MKLIRMLYENRIIVFAVIGGLASYCWQVYQGSTDVSWNIGMGLIGIIAGTLLGGIE
jgi:hypothetical protein